MRVWVPMGASLYTFKGGRVRPRGRRRRAREKRCSNHLDDGAQAELLLGADRVPVYSWVTEDDLEMELLDAVRDALRANDADHPWLSLSDSELLRAARLYGRDQLTGE